MIKLLNRIQIKIVFTLMLMAIVSQYTSLEVAVLVSFGVMALTLIPAYSVKGIARDEVLSRMFSRDLQEKLWPSNEFYVGAQTDPNVAIDQELIEIPQDEDGRAKTVRNPTQFPLPTYSEADTKKSYGSELIATLPQRIGRLNQQLLSYDKRAAKVRKHQATLQDDAANVIAHGWMPTKAEFKRATTGSEVRAASANGAGGNRKRVAKADIFWLMTMFNKLNVPMPGRRLFLNALMYEDLFTIDEFISSEKLRAPGQLSEGALGRVMGFEVFMRSETPQVASDGTTKAWGAASAANDNAAAIAFHPSFVRYAYSAPHAYYEVNNGSYLGDLLNFEIRVGAATSRISETGVLALYEGAE